MKTYLFVFVLAFFISTFSFSQEFGEVNEDELKMTECKEDPDADAIVLFDLGVMRITRDFNLRMSIHIRMKILTEAGKKNADKKLSFFYKDELLDLEAASYSPGGEVFELDEDNVFEEEAGNAKTISFAIPGVEVGSVIEFRYEYFSEYITGLEPWYFQSGNYAKMSQLKVLMSPRFAYNSVKKNFEKYDFEEKKEMVRDPDEFNKEIAQFTWTGRNLPSITQEPFMDNIGDEYAKIIFFLHSYKDEYQDYNFSRSWDEIGKKIYENYREKFIEGGLVETTVNEIIKNETDSLQKAVKIFNFVKDEIKTDEGHLSKSDWDPEKVITEKAGDSDEKNTLLINMLMQAGMEAKPLLISSRGHGEVIKDFPDPGQFNELLCYVKIVGKTYFLNTSHKSAPFGYLIPYMDVLSGLLIDEKTCTIINIKPLRSFNRMLVTTTGKMGEDGTIKANSEIIYSGFNAIVERDSIENQKELKKYVEKLLKELDKEILLDTFYYAGIDSINNPLTLNVSYTLRDYVEDSDKYFYFIPPMLTNIKTNPFTRPKRNYNICFDYDEYVTENMKLELAPGLSINELPQNGSASVSEYTYRRSYSKGENFVECSRSENLKQRIINFRFYDDLKQMYNSMLSQDQQQIVFSKPPSGNAESK